MTPNRRSVVFSIVALSTGLALVLPTGPVAAGSALPTTAVEASPIAAPPTLAVSLAAQELRIMKFAHDGTFISQYTVPEFDGDFGRVRAAQLGPQGALYVTTDNGGGADRIIKVTPS